ncbi:MAG: hypothetical protein IPP94_14470, partial [Ignavibacteria bacterium]|nr:hypothetical protein [Ignavibacteria bacterium]
MHLFHTVDSSRARRLAALTVFFAAVMAASAIAQTPQYNNGGSGNSNNIYPFQTTSTTKVEQHYLPNEFSGAYAGRITKVYWKGNAAWTATTYTNLKIWLGQSTSSSFPSATTYTTAGMTLAYSAASSPIPAGAAGGWFGFTLNTPYPYNPSQSLIVIVCHEGYSGGGVQIRASSMTVPPYRRIYGSGGANCAGTAGNSDGNWYDFGIDLSSAYLNDAGIQNLLSPVNFCASTQNITVNLMNYGQNALTSTTIKWVYDGTPQTDIPWSGTLASLASTPITLGSRTFAGGVPHTLKVWTSMPNTVSDSGVFNDTLTTTLKPALSGTFTVGGASPNYPNLAAVAADLNANGICGPVVFNVRTGTYTEQFNLANIAGASSTNTITFQSESGNKTDVTLTYGPTSTANNWTVNMSGADWVTFKNMTIKSTGTTYSNVFAWGGGANDNTIQNCALSNPIMASTSTYNAIVYSASSVDDRNQFIGNTFDGGSMAFYWWGSTYTPVTSCKSN